MGDSTFRYPPGAPGVRVGGTRPGDRGAGSPPAASPPAGSGTPARGKVRGWSRLRFPAAASRGGATTEGPAPAVTYWRRRFVVLAVALATLAVAAWSLSEALRVQPDLKPPSTVGHGPSGGTAHHGSGSGGAGTGSGHQPGTATKPTSSTSPGAFGGFKPKFCSWHSIVISASATQVSFTAGQRPNFSLSVVSTQPTDCSFNVGPGHLALIIKEGPAKLWSSADCVKGTGSLITALHRGVPTVVAIGWNKKTSTPGCGGPARSVPAGTYTAYAVDGSLVSTPVTFRLG